MSVKDNSVFPDPIYAQTVLEPLFEGVKTHFARGMDRINRAHLVMLAQTGILSGPDAGEIAAALRVIEASTDPAALPYTGEHEDYFFYVEARLREALGDLGGALHTARSRNDMDHTLFRMALLERAQVMQAQLHGLIAALLVKAEAEADTLIVAYTHGQPAQPSTFGHYLLAVVEGLLGDCARLEAAIADLDACPMGAAAITTSGFPINRHLMADLLGFHGPTLNAYGSIAGVGYISGLYSALRLVFLHLGRVVQDLAFWSSFEVGQLYVPNALVQVSSIMPQKRNPVPVEHMRHLASATMGRCDMVINCLHNTPFTDMNDSEGEVQQAGFAAFESGARMLALLRAFLPACSINGERVAQNTERACITITELADTLVRTQGLSFRQAHEIAAHTSQAVIARSEPLAKGYGAFREAYEAQTGVSATLSEAAFQEAVNPRSFVTRRDRHGGPAPDAQQQARAHYHSALDSANTQATCRHQRQTAAATRLTAAFNAI